MGISALPARSVATSMAASLWRFWTGGRPVERACYLIGAVLFAAGLFHLGVFAVDGGPWEGPVSWRKPTTFGLSFGLTLVTIAGVTTFVRLGERTRGWLLGVFAAACVLEVAFISVQAWRHVPSHFNNEGPVNTAIAMVLAAGGVVLVVILVTLTVASFRKVPEPAPDDPAGPADAAAGPAMRLAVQAGFVALLFALASGAAMIAKGMVLVKTGHQHAAYTAAEALKPAHAVTMHAILVLPGLAWLLTFTTWTERRRRRAVARVALAYGLAAAAVIVVSAVRFA
ncbi:hypothetical protein ACRYCC_24635 [Actinomadura scrupuli]|uniref:hypothetical protein n=1 Tax=Actinomadura scrupuli TaxID=559629 RepID=UPI003D97525D